jgi:hypothetical protein
VKIDGLQIEPLDFFLAAACGCRKLLQQSEVSSSWLAGSRVDGRQAATGHPATQPPRAKSCLMYHRTAVHNFEGSSSQRELEKLVFRIDANLLWLDESYTELLQQYNSQSTKVKRKN